MPAIAFGVFFAVAALFGLLGLVYVTTRDVPRITGTLAFIATLAAFGLAVHR
ncbi:hypothetical protein [Streptomyces sp. BE230]|uniref:hypothetical protein n=1 Tax=Streptomyces sp. BE230 TaxID=3002526 RepID=UPI002ED6850C|nr:hypothetical protein [Streptomyces sp. BE230]